MLAVLKKELRVEPHILLILLEPVLRCALELRASENVARSHLCQLFVTRMEQLWHQLWHQSWSQLLYSRSATS